MANVPTIHRQLLGSRISLHLTVSKPNVLYITFAVGDLSSYMAPGSVRSSCRHQAPSGDDDMLSGEGVYAPKLAPAVIEMMLPRQRNLPLPSGLLASGADGKRYIVPHVTHPPDLMI
jgi:hypothetical protein